MIIMIMMQSMRGYSFFNIEIADRGYGEIGSNDTLGRHTRAVRSINN